MLYKVEKGVIVFMETEEISTFISVVGSELQSESRQLGLAILPGPEDPNWNRSENTSSGPGPGLC